MISWDKNNFISINKVNLSKHQLNMCQRGLKACALDTLHQHARTRFKHYINYVPVLCSRIERSQIWPLRDY